MKEEGERDFPPSVSRTAGWIDCGLIEGGGMELEIEAKERLLASLKKEVKAIMEEVASGRHINFESYRLGSLCAAVENCLAFGLHRRVTGLFGSSSSFALLHKIASRCPPASSVLKSLLLEQKSTSASASQLKFVWIRIAVTDHILPSILLFLHHHAE